MSTAELACVYATVALHDDGIPVTVRPPSSSSSSSMLLLFLFDLKLIPLMPTLLYARPRSVNIIYELIHIYIYICLYPVIYISFFFFLNLGIDWNTHFLTNFLLNENF